MTPMIFLPKMHEPNLNKRKHEINWPVLFKSVKFMKAKERLRNCPRLEIKETSQLNTMHNSELGPFVIGYYRDNWQNLN